MKTLLLGLIATFVTSFAVAAPHDEPNYPRRPMPTHPSRPDEIVRLGGTRLGPITDSDLIQVNSCGAGEEGRISAIRIKAIERSARIGVIRVTYANQSSQDIRVNANLREGQSTRWIDLMGSGRGRCVQSIRINGRSRAPAFRQATVEVFGRRHYRTALELQDRREEN